MEPAVLYLTFVTGVAVAWIAGDGVWTFALWALRRDAGTARGIASFATIMVVVMFVAGSWKAPSAGAEVLPPSHRVMTAGPTPAIEATSALTFLSMVEGSEPLPSSYTVVSGDCLWSIARAAIVADGVKPTGAMIASLWKRIYETNSDVIGANPRLIFPGQILDIPER